MRRDILTTSKQDAALRRTQPTFEKLIQKDNQEEFDHALLSYAKRCPNPAVLDQRLQSLREVLWDIKMLSRQDHVQKRRLTEQKDKQAEATRLLNNLKEVDKRIQNYCDPLCRDETTYTNQDHIQLALANPDQDIPALAYKTSRDSKQLLLSAERLLALSVPRNLQGRQMKPWVDRGLAKIRRLGATHAEADVFLRAIGVRTAYVSRQSPRLPHPQIK